MAKRDNHYEAAFEAFLRARRIPYVAVDEAKRSVVSHAASTDQTNSPTLKNVDFVVSPQMGQGSWLVDVKGRRFPTGTRRQFWKNWSTGDELRILSAREELFGPGFTGLLVFAYDVRESVSPVPPELLFAFKNRLYGFVGVRLDHYLSGSKRISPRWDTYAMSAPRFRQLARSADFWFGTPVGIETEKRAGVPA
jgi:hypothetical protein